VNNLVGEDFSSGDIVAVTEAARENHNMKAVEDALFFYDLIYVYPLGVCSGEIECIFGLCVTIDACSS